MKKSEEIGINVKKSVVLVRFALCAVLMWGDFWGENREKGTISQKNREKGTISQKKQRKRH